MAEQTAGKRVDHLDGIRAIAITGVLCMHWAAQYTPFGFGGTVGVDIFFVLSGFIITTLLSGRRTVRAASAASTLSSCVVACAAFIPL